MTSSPFTVPSGSIKKNLKRILNHWAFIGVIFSAIGTLFGFGILSVYLNAIGLPELFPSALDTKTALIPWIILVALLLLAYIFLLSFNSIIFASGATIFNKQPHAQPRMVLLLAIPVLLGISVQMGGIVWGVNTLLTILMTTLAEISIFLMLMRSERFSIAIHVSGFMGQPELGTKWQARIGLLIPLFIVVFATVLTAVFPVQVVLSTYPSPTDPQSALKLTGMAILVASMALVPAIIFFSLGKDLLAKIRNTLAVLALMMLMMLAIAPRTFPSIVYRTAYLMGLRDTTITSFLLTETYAVEDFDSGWARVDVVRDHPVVRGFPLLSLGDLLILCPANLVGTELQDWPDRSHACLITDTKTAKRLPEKQAKKRHGQIRIYEV